MQNVICPQLKKQFEELKGLRDDFVSDFGKMDVNNIDQAMEIKERIIYLEKEIFKQVNTEDPYMTGLRKRIADKLELDFVFKFFNGLARAKKDGKFLYINNYGKEITSDRFESAGDFSDGLACVKKDGQWYYIDKTGKEITSDRFDSVGYFYDGLARVCKDGKFYFIDKTGKQITSEGFDNAENFSDGLARVRKDDQEYYIDKKGRKIFDAK